MGVETSTMEDRVISGDNSHCFNFYAELQGIADEIPNLPPHFRHDAASDLLEMWRLHLKVEKMLDPRGA